MPVLNDADNIFAGVQQVDAVYAGTELVWSPVSVMERVPTILIPTVGGARSDFFGDMTFTDRNGRIWTMFGVNEASSNIQHSYSDDGGATWSAYQSSWAPGGYNYWGAVHYNRRADCIYACVGATSASGALGLIPNTSTGEITGWNTSATSLISFDLSDTMPPAVNGFQKADGSHVFVVTRCRSANNVGYAHTWLGADDAPVRVGNVSSTESTASHRSVATVFYQKDANGDPINGDATPIYAQLGGPGVMRKFDAVNELWSDMPGTEVVNTGSNYDVIASAEASDGCYFLINSILTTNDFPLRKFRYSDETVVDTARGTTSRGIPSQAIPGLVDTSSQSVRMVCVADRYLIISACDDASSTTWPTEVYSVYDIDEDYWSGWFLLDPVENNRLNDPRYYQMFADPVSGNVFRIGANSGASFGQQVLKLAESKGSKLALRREMQLIAGAQTNDGDDFTDFALTGEAATMDDSVEWTGPLLETRKSDELLVATASLDDNRLQTEWPGAPVPNWGDEYAWASNEFYSSIASWSRRATADSSDYFTGLLSPNLDEMLGSIVRVTGTEKFGLSRFNVTSVINNVQVNTLFIDPGRAVEDGILVLCVTQRDRARNNWATTDKAGMIRGPVYNLFGNQFNPNAPNMYFWKEVTQNEDLSQTITMEGNAQYGVGITACVFSVRDGSGPIVSNYFEGGDVIEGVGYREHTFLTDGTLTFVDNDGLGTPVDIDYLVVAAGGNCSFSSIGGGGGGGVITNSASVATDLAAVIGQGSSSTSPVDGGNSTFNGETAIGGGASPSGSTGPGRAGGSGSGGLNSTGGAGTPGQGNDGGSGNGSYGGGGGGAGEAGGNGTGAAREAKGGDGIEWPPGSGEFFGGGGGGGGPATSNTGLGGLGGGGNGGNVPIVTRNGVNGKGGGGGGSANGQSAAAGGHGVVKVRYPIVRGTP